MSVPGLLHHRVARAFARAAPGYDEVSRVFDEVGRRLLAHLDPIACGPARVLDVGCGTGTGAAQLASRYPRSRVYAVDCAWPMLRVAKTRAPKLFSRQHQVCAWAERLPMGTHCVDLVHANLLLPWCLVPERALREFARVLAPGGLLLLSSLGPDTLIELRRAWAQRDEPAAVPGLLDMHDLGDALVGTGFGGTVMETERLTVQYRSMARLLDDLERSGAWAARTTRGAARRSRESFAELRRRYRALRSAGPVDVTIEIVYAHAWAPPSPLPQSIAVPPPPLRRDPSGGA